MFDKASDTSERWADVTMHLDEQIINLINDIDRLHIFDERFEQSTKILTNLRSQHEDFLVQFHSVKSMIEKFHLYLHEYKRKSTQINDENRHLRIETKRLREKIDDYHRTESLMHAKITEQDINLSQLRKELT